jgi:hypothetical protein
MTTQKDVFEKEKELEKEIQKTIRLQERLLKDAKEFKGQFSERLLKLVTSGFGLVSALAPHQSETRCGTTPHYFYHHSSF